jgi:hypothetical protein
MKGRRKDKSAILLRMGVKCKGERDKKRSIGGRRDGRKENERENYKKKNIKRRKDKNAVTVKSRK